MSSHSNLSSPTTTESENGGPVTGNSKFKTLKKKIRNKFRLSRPAEGTKTIAQAVETLRRSNELLTETDDSDALKSEFKELKETLESILNQNQILSEVVKTVDSTCPDPFNEPEKFSVFFAQKTVSSRSYSDDLFDDSGDVSANGTARADVAIAPTAPMTPTAPISPIEPISPAVTENAVVRLQNLRMEEQKSFQMERENYESRLAQLSLLHGEIEILRKQNSEHEIQLEFLKMKSSPAAEEVEILRNENGELKRKYEELGNELGDLRGRGKAGEADVDEIAALRDSHAKEIAELRGSHAKVLSELRELHTKELIELRDTQAIELDSSHTKELTHIKDSHTKELDHIRDSHAKELTELRDALTKEIAELRDSLAASESQLQDLETQSIQPADSAAELKTQLDEAIHRLKLHQEQESTEIQEEKDRQFRELSEENVRLRLDFAELEKELKTARTQLTDFEKEAVSEIDLAAPKPEPPATTNEDDSAFKYVYLSNLVLKFMQFPEKRAALSNIILTTLQSDQEYFQRAMSKQQQQ